METPEFAHGFNCLEKEYQCIFIQDFFVVCLTAATVSAVLA